MTQAHTNQAKPSASLNRIASIDQLRGFAILLMILADFFNNVRDILASPPRDWSLERKREYLLWTERVVAGLRGVNPALEARYDEILAQGKRELGMI